jgi:hypothetical protein
MSVRDRIEAQQLAAKYAAQSAPRIAQQEQDEKRERLAQNYRNIVESRLQTLLLDCTDDERSVCNDIINADRPNCLGNYDVVAATLLRVREEGTAALRLVMQNSTRQEQQEVWQILKDTPAREKLGMDQGRKCREVLAQVREKLFMEEN